MWVQVIDAITDAKFFGSRLRSFEVTEPSIVQTPFPT